MVKFIEVTEEEGGIQTKMLIPIDKITSIADIREGSLIFYGSGSVYAKESFTEIKKAIENQ